MKAKLLRFGSLTGLAVGLGACHPAEREPELQPASATFVSNDRAIERLAMANCERELACDNIGAGRRYESAELCRNTFEREKYEELGFRQCVLGVDNVEVENCAREIMATNCNLPLDTLEGMRWCTSVRLCRDRR